MKKWYVIQTRPKQEYIALENLKRQKYTVFFPEKPIDLRCNSKFKRDMEMLFPCYGFIRLSKENDWRSIQGTYGVKGLVKFGQEIPYIEDEIINDLMKIERVYKTDYEVGDKVIFNDKSFIDVPAIVQLSDLDRVQVLMSVLGTERLVSVDRRQISPSE